MGDRQSAYVLLGGWAGEEGYWDIGILTSYCLGHSSLRLDTNTHTHTRSIIYVGSLCFTFFTFFPSFFLGCGATDDTMDLAGCPLIPLGWRRAGFAITVLNFILFCFILCLSLSLSKQWDHRDSDSIFIGPCNNYTILNSWGVLSTPLLYIYYFLSVCYLVNPFYGDTYLLYKLGRWRQ